MHYTHPKTTLMNPLKSIIRLGALVALSLLPFTSAVSAADWDTPPSVKKSVAPKNPNKLVGMVSATIEIDEKGYITSAKISKASDRLLEDPVLTALKGWRFSPAKLDGKAIACSIKVPFKFKH